MIRNNIEGGRRLGKLGKAVLAGSLAFAGGATLEVATQDSSPQAVAFAVDAAGSTPDRTISCRRSNRWYPLNQGETVTLDTRGAIAIADISVGGKFQSDNEADTTTVLVFKSDDRNKKTWNLENNYGGSILVPACDVSGQKLDKLAGAWTRRTDVDLGKNDPVKRVNENWLIK
ncbi:MAG: hypothetical protein COU25_01520 [Candidatus Levybacteria bacterium CG10_big_fil_rev_8_21_14_0_10_35_13]|nr:MAG: hypothetical protein COU25_01520 [Candidatus Levybacteria bacterium CG10_big_fil_rev_8_21_14_0_10_35_13]